MYINIKKHILSNAIRSVALVKILAAFVEGAARYVLKKNGYTDPDMLDTLLWRFQIGTSILQIIAVILIFNHARKTLKYYMDMVPKEDRDGFGILQREYLGSKVASLSVSSINRLLQLWAVIFIGAELLYDFTSIMYREFISILMEALSSGTGLSDGTFIIIYNMTHGFKYIEILSAILLGVVMTGIFLNDRLLKIVSLAILLAFLLAFSILQMQTISLMGREFGIVWTSLIYHVTETFGLIALSFYLTWRYRGL
jgi:hypothetical protein